MITMITMIEASTISRIRNRIVVIYLLLPLLVLLFSSSSASGCRMYPTSRRGKFLLEFIRFFFTWKCSKRQDGKHLILKQQQRNVNDHNDQGFNSFTDSKSSRRNRIITATISPPLPPLLVVEGIRQPEEGKLFSSSFFFSSAQNVQNNRRMEKKLLMCKPDIVITFFTTNSSQSLFSSVSSNAATIYWYRIEPQGKERTNERTNKQQQNYILQGEEKTKERIISNLLHRHLTNHKGIKSTLTYCGVEAGCCLSLFSACMKS
jgi:hypothetical protein